MLIYKCVCTGDEVLTDAFKLETVDEEFLLKCHGKMTQIKSGGGISADLIGGNPSQEEGGDDVDESEDVKSGIDVIMHNNLEDRSDFFGSKKILQSYLKKWAKNVAAALAEDKAKCDEFKKVCSSKLKTFLDLFTDNTTVYAGEHFDPEEAKSCPVLGVWSDDGMEMDIYMIRLGLEEEKC